MKALQAIQTELKAPKSLYNSFGKYHYRSAESILEAVKPLLAKHNAELTLSDDIVAVNERIYVKAMATITDGTESVTVTAFAREPDDKKGMDSSQITGTASSYARKYALNGLFLIDDTKDADTDEYHNQTTEPSIQVKVETYKQMQAEIHRTGTDINKLCAFYKVKALNELTEEQAQKALKQLAKKTTVNAGAE
jgi:hypothetical protein